MNISIVLDVAVGLALVFLVFSVAASKVNEVVMGFLNFRGQQLEAAIARLVDDPGQTGAVTQKLMDGAWNNLRVVRSTTAQVPAMATAELTVATAAQRFNLPARMAGLRKNGQRARTLSLPAYISGDAFAKGILGLLGVPGQDALNAIVPASLPPGALPAYAAAQAHLDLVTANALLAALPAIDPAAPVDPAVAAVRAQVQAVVAAVAADPVTMAENVVDQFPDGSPIRAKLLSLIGQVGADRDKIRQGVIAWYDEAMDRLSGAYKRHVQRYLMAYSIVLILVFNVNAIALTTSLWQSGPTRAVAVAAAQAQLSSSPPTSTGLAGDTQTATKEVQDAESLSLPLGWATTTTNASDPRELSPSAQTWLLRILGWLITLIALMFGAPFWFDALGKLVNMRSSGPSSTAAAKT